jgi:hypothetical protein
MNKKYIILIVTVWGLASAYVGAVLMARHEVSFQLSESVLGRVYNFGKDLLQEGNSKPYIAIHLLDERCTCSQTVIEDILDTSISDASLLVLMLSKITEETRARFESKGINVRELDPKEAREQFGLETAPWFVVLDRELQVLYSGGYSQTKVRARSDLRVSEIMKTIRDQRKPASLPTFGCVTSNELRRLLLQF